MERRLSKEVLQRISWDWHPLADIAQEKIDEPGMDWQKVEIYRKLLMSVRWYELIKMLTPEQMREALSEEVVKTLWPAGVKKTFTYVAGLFQKSALSPTG